MSEAWWYWDSGPLPPSLNMAWDEALLEHAVRMGQPLLRTYAWTVPGATFGYFQRYEEVASLTSLRPLIRRPTGGGLVPHDADWTYSVILPPGHPWHGTRAVDSYRRLHLWQQAAFARCGVQTWLAPEKDSSGPGQCFVGAERDDLLLPTGKLGGAAQRRNRCGLLIQGSLQPPPPQVSRSAWWEALRDVASGTLWQPWLPERVVEDRARHLAATKYEQDAYLRKR